MTPRASRFAEEARGPRHECCGSFQFDGAAHEQLLAAAGAEGAAGRATSRRGAKGAVLGNDA